MHTYKITLHDNHTIHLKLDHWVKEIKVIYHVMASSNDEALEKAKSGNATFIDGMMLGNPSDYFELEILE